MVNFDPDHNNSLGVAALPDSDFSTHLVADPTDRVAFSEGVKLALYGQSPLVVFKGVISNEVCEQLRDRAASIGDRPDGIPLLELGPTHYDKSVEDYFEEVAETRRALQDFLQGIDPNPVAEINRRMIEALGGNSILRAACYNGQEAADFRVRVMPPTSYQARPSEGFYIEPYDVFVPDGLSLLPHEDVSQVRDPRQHAFEISRVEHVVGINLCFDTHPEAPGSRLHVYNLPGGRPDAPEIQTSPGYPYPVEYARQADHLEFQPEAGDAWAVLGDLLHAVGDAAEYHFPTIRRIPETGKWTGHVPPHASSRGTIQWFVGQLKDEGIEAEFEPDTFVRWT